MFRTIILLSPIYVTLFWSIALAGNNQKHSKPRQFLGRFMLFPLIIYISHFLYFYPAPNFYPYFDVVLQYASLMVFPMYYIYFRLLTVDEKFLLKVHGRFLTIPVIIAVMYGIGVFLTPRIEFRAWLYDQNAYQSSQHIQFLNTIRTVVRITYLIQVVLSVIGNYLLIKKYEAKAEQFYSDIQDGKYNNAKMLNYSIIAMSVAAFTFTALGRQFLMPQNTIIYLGWSIFSTMLFIIGYMGIKQKPINPTFDKINSNSVEDNEFLDLSESAQNKILKKVLVEFDEKKNYLNSQLNIMDIVNAVGTNRTYISSIINQQYNQNFCSFVNSYRIDELERVICANPEYTNETLAECCGFGSVNSLKRSVFSKTGLSMSDWKNQIIQNSIQNKTQTGNIYDKKRTSK
jgi:AraC-like DNA-binding protein